MHSISKQDLNIIAYLIKKKEVYWEELTQFCKNPAQVKLKTVKKIISDIKKKFRENNIDLPFDCVFKNMPQESPKMVAMSNNIDFNGQNLVQVKLNKKPTISNQVAIDNDNSVKNTPVPDFVIKQYSKQIITKSGTYSLGDDEFEIFAYMHRNRGIFISLEELRDNVCYPKHGSKTPARWFLSIQRRIGNIRHQIPETRQKLLTVKQDNNSGYLFNKI